MHFYISSFISPDQIFNITFHEKKKQTKQASLDYPKVGIIEVQLN